MTRRVAVAVQRRGRVEQFELQFEALRVGSASHCDIRLGPDEAAPEQLLLEPRDNGMWLRSLSHEPRVLLNGKVLVSALVEARARIELGGVALTLELVNAAPKQVSASSTRKTVRQLVMLLGLAALYYYVLYEAPPESALARQLPPPALFAAAEPLRCPHEDPLSARAFAREQLAIADSQRERSPFSMRDGVQAVPNYQLAAACFAFAGDEADARTVDRTGQQLAEKLQEELHAHQVRLDWFLDRHRFGPAFDEVRTLRELLADRDDAYTRWLGAVAHELQTLRAMSERATSEKE
jgi:Inner membrane component of T3SS, cytoplasmic domain